jgi:NAD(P)-dependent dehydrogenase (short-subunit alcohol dehydrogenase family)
MPDGKDHAHDGPERVAIVTGGTRGIGAAISRRLAADGASVAAVYNTNRQAAEHFAEEAFADELSISLHQANVANPGDCQRVVDEVLLQHGRVDYLINNAGAVRDRTTLKMQLLDWDQVIKTNLYGPFFMAKAVLGHMLDRGSGRIINIGSFVARTGRVGQANYAAAKSGLFGLTRTLALETAQKGVTVNCIIPGAIKTEMVGALPEDILEAVIETVPMHELGTPEDVAQAVHYLVSDEAHYLTGVFLPVAGGLIMM